MVSYGFLTAVLDLIGLASTVTVIVWLVFGLQPLFERVRDSCRACQPPEGRALLLWTAFLIHIAWVSAAALYFRNLFSLWNFMETWLENQPVNRTVYALLHLYLFVLLFCGIYAYALTVSEISQHREVFSDLVMIARFNTRKHQAIEDLEAQHSSCSTDPVDAGAETSIVGNMRNTSSLSQDEGSRRNDQVSNEDVAPAKARINEPENPTEEAAWPGDHHPVGEIITRTVHSPMWSVKCSSWPTVGGWSYSDAAGLSNQRHPVTLDSDGDTITMTPSSPSSSNGSSGIDEPEYVDDDRYGVRLREPLENRKQRSKNASQTIDQGGHVEDDDDDDPYGLYYATPRLSPQVQNSRIDVEPLDLGEPHSPCDSCSSAHAESIPTAKRSPGRIPITPTSPTADANDADTEKTDVERKQRERKNRNSAMYAPQSPHANTSKTLPPYDPKILLFGIDPNLGNDEESVRALASNNRAHSLEQRERTAASARTSGKPKPKTSLMSGPALYTRPATPPLDGWDREAGLFWRSREADNSESAASPDEHAYNVTFDGQIMVDTRTGMRRRIHPPMRPRQRKRPGSPYPFSEGRQATGPEGGRGQRDLSLEIPDPGLDSHGGEVGQVIEEALSRD